MKLCNWIKKTGLTAGSHFLQYVPTEIMAWKIMSGKLLDFCFSMCFWQLFRLGGPRISPFSTLQAEGDYKFADANSSVGTEALTFCRIVQI